LQLDWYKPAICFVHFWLARRVTFSQISPALCFAESACDFVVDDLLTGESPALSLAALSLAALSLAALSLAALSLAALSLAALSLAALSLAALSLAALSLAALSS
jgi:hypothetical protein